MRARIVLAALAVLVLGWTGTAEAEKKRVGVPRFDGPQEGVVRRAVVHVLKADGYEVVGAHELDDAAKTTGTQLDSNDGFKAVAKELAISAFVTGEVAKKKAKLTVRNGADGSVSGEGSFGGANPNKVAADVREGFSRRLGSAVERGRAPAGAKTPAPATAEAEEPEDNSAAGGSDDSAAAAKASSSSSKSASTDETPPADAGGSSPEGVVARKAEPPPEEAGAAGPRALDIQVGVRGFSRSLSYNQDYFSALRSYKLTLGPAVVANVLLFPLAFGSGGFAGNFGIEANVEQAFGVSSSISAGATYPTSIHDYNAGVRGRLPLSGGHEIALFVGGGEHAFSFRDGTNAPRSGLTIPDTIYHYVRVGLDGRFELPGGLTAGASAGYRYVFNKAGQIGSAATTLPDGTVTMGYFPYLTVAGIEASAMLGYHITPSIEARFDVDIRRYFYAMNSAQADLMATPAPNKVAGGAVDQYVGFTIGAAYVFGGAPPGPSTEEPAEAAPPPKKKHKKKKKGDDEDQDSGDSAGSGDSGGGAKSGSGDSDE
jgi:hypothetical protein